MSTPPNIDPAVLAQLMAQLGMEPKSVEDMLQPKFATEMASRFFLSVSDGSFTNNSPSAPGRGSYAMDNILQSPSPTRISGSENDSIVKKHENMAAKSAQQSPKQVPTLSRSRVISFLDRNRIERERHNVMREGVAHYNVYVEMRENFSRTQLNDLKSVCISSMLVHNRHEGRYILCRTITEAVLQISITIGIEDIEGSLECWLYQICQRWPLRRRKTWTLSFPWARSLPSGNQHTNFQKTRICHTFAFTRLPTSSS
ncbi:hypothetical protein BD410DRAFT_637662 [Rickenella mellea]|uniref:Orange domain-containing protein n=1 Tax=Rickenella mellea TaxID=50990 RepID=A0A4Y7QCH0_9AGAM|nr:hypothetical protein BD410DRAFT_637662 [Rickenella mellea]